MQASYGDVVLRQHDISTLQPGQWLNDQAIEFALSRFEGLANRIGCVVVPPATSQLFLHAPEVAPSVARDLQLDPSRGKPIVFCLNNATDVTKPLSGSHWSALVVTGSPVVKHVHYDSLNGVNDRIAERLSNTLNAVLGPGDAELVHERSFNCRQKNPCDCGVFMLAVAQAYMKAGGEGQDALDRLLGAIDQDGVRSLRQALIDAVNELAGVSE